VQTNIKKKIKKKNRKNKKKKKKKKILILICISVTPDYTGQVALSSTNTAVWDIASFITDWFPLNFRNPARNKHKLFGLKKFIGF